jgi:hypothetical protein
VGGPRSLLPFYFHLTFFIAAILLGLDTVLSFLRVGGDDLDRSARHRGRGRDPRRDRRQRERNQPGAAAVRAPSCSRPGVVLVRLTLRTGGLSSPYFVLVAATCLFAGLASAGLGHLREPLIAVAYVSGSPRGRTSTMPAAAATPDRLLVHLAFLLLTTSLASRVASASKTVATLGSVDARPATSRQPSLLPPRRWRASEQAERFAWPITMLIIDLDHFKRMNDAYGHARRPRPRGGREAPPGASARSTTSRASAASSPWPRSP